MIIRYFILSLFFLLTSFSTTEARNPGNNRGKKKQTSNQQASLREPCTPGGSQATQDINNVRALLLINGDCWWDGDNPQYIVPKVPTGEVGVSAIFAGAVWIGGFDNGGNLKLAAKTFGASTGDTDYWPGPINLDTLIEDDVLCRSWDKHFEVLSEDIDLHIRNYIKAVEADETYESNTIPRSILGWPAKGNPFFEDIHEFSLPNNDQGLAGFFDADSNDEYDPTQGDYPTIEVRGCDLPNYPDQMIFWIYNDGANVHSESNADPMDMEVQVQSFAYRTTDELNDMTFQRYKLINRGTEPLDSTFFAIWVDPDLGCAFDDYVGCDIDRSLAYIYNSDLADGQAENSCDCSGTPTYCTEIPVLGVDYFRGPLDEFGEELGMSSFVYYNNGGATPTPAPGTDDPGIGPEFYNYLSGSWRDGLPFTSGGSARNSGDPTRYVFPGRPNDGNAWSMATEELSTGDRRTLQASGPFRLDPGATNELIIGAVFVANIPNHPNIDLGRLLLADDIAQAAFDNCFAINKGPDAPDLDFLELDQELICFLSNEADVSNNFNEAYTETDLRAPNDSIMYVFEGYEVYQLRSIDADIDDIDNARRIFNVDIKNGVTNVYDVLSMDNPLNPFGGPNPFIYEPIVRAEGRNDGIRKSFKITSDAFTNTPLINHKKYYYKAIAYGYNNYLNFDPTTGDGQRRQYISSSRNLKEYTVIPRPITTLNVNSAYGEGPIITRTDGVGAGSNFLDVTDESREAILNGTNDGKVVYQKGEGPIDVKVINPLEVIDGEYELHITDQNDDGRLDSWIVTDQDGNETRSEKESIQFLNEQLLARYGFSVNIAQTNDAGDRADNGNGTIGAELNYADEFGEQWLNVVMDQGAGPFDYIKTNNTDPSGAFASLGDGAVVPFRLTDNSPATFPFIISPFWDASGALQNVLRGALPPLQGLNNVDIVLTADKDKWSRCVIVETSSRAYYSVIGLELETEGGAESLELRQSPSVGKNAGSNDKPQPDNETDADGEPRLGMGWFPGYAIDVETGERLNIFFGENSVFDCSVPEVGELCNEGAFDDPPTGRDMMFNPTDQQIVGNPGNDFNALNAYGGGQHFIYVTNTKYDACESIYNRIKLDADFTQYLGLADITWTSFPLLTEGSSLLSYDEGLIPNDVTYKLRVDNPYQVKEGMGMNEGEPTYLISFQGVKSEELANQTQLDSALSQINVVPNPYYGFSDYETDALDNKIKITNLPAKAVVTIYTLDGKFVRQYNRDEVGLAPQGSSINLQQVLPDIEWDLKNFKNIPVGSGVYLIHVEAPGYGERMLKWFGVARQFDPNGL